jgi:serine/threonine-protein kinase
VEYVSSVVGASAAGPDDAELPQLSGYEVLGVLGKGGMGIVYKARQRGLGRAVAVKMILAGAHAGARVRGRFRREAEAVARLQHPGIIQIFEIGEHEGQPFLSLELVEGGGLDRRLREAPPSAREAAEMVRRLAEAVAYAHRHGVVHRDLKPANVLLTADGTPKISDFGLAKYLEEEGGQTQDGAVLGTPGYMAPEQAQGRVGEIGPAVDVWALGAILYELLTGRPPFKGSTVWDTLQMVRTTEPVAPRQIRSRVPRDLETMCLKCLEKEPRKRYATADDLAEDLRLFLAGQPIRARPVGAAGQLWRWCRRNPGVAVLWGLILALLVTVAITSTAAYYEVRAERDASEFDRQTAHENFELAKKNFELASQQKARAEANERAARDQANVATHYLTQLIERTERRLKARPGEPADPAVAALRRDLVPLGRQTLTNMARDFDRIGMTSFAGPAALQQLGDVFRRQGNVAEARAYYRQALDQVEQVSRQHPEMDRGRANRALLLSLLGDLILEKGGDLSEARDDFRQALQLQQEVAAHGPTSEYSLADNTRLLARYQVHLARVSLRLGEPAVAHTYAQEAAARRKALADANPRDVSTRSFLAEAYFVLGEAAWRASDAQAARDAYDKALDVCTGLTQKFPASTDFKVDLAQVASDYGEVLLRQGKGAEADRLLTEHLPKLEALAKTNPDDLSLRSLHALTCYRTGLVLLSQRRPQEAGNQFRAARHLWEALAADEPANTNHELALLPVRARGGDVARAADRTRSLAGKAAPHHGVELQAARCLAQCAAATSDAAQRQRYLTEAVALLGRLADGGYKDVTTLQTDPDLEPLQNDVGFQQLLERVRRP